jgi:cyclase
VSGVRRYTALIAAVAIAVAPGAAQAQQGAPALGAAPPGAAYEGRAFSFTRIADGVYHAVGTGALAVGSHAAVIVNEQDVVIVDSHVSPAAAWALVRELKEITPLPVRTVVNTHFHYDHVQGNQVFGPDVTIIGHEFTRTQVLAGATRRGAAYDGLLRVFPVRRDSLRRALAAARSDSARAVLRGRLAYFEQYQLANDAVTLTVPNVTLTQTLTLYRGAREIRLLFFGRGHTGGDVVVYLPAERVLVTGDLVGSGLPYLGDGYMDEWAATLDQLNTLPWEVILAGHGPPVRDRATPGKLASLLRDFQRQATMMLDQGLSIDAIEPRLDFTAHVAAYPALADRRSDDLRERFYLGLFRIRALRSEGRN